MRFPVYFKRRKGAAPADLAAIGSDSAPTFATPVRKNADNILSHKLSRPVNRIALGYWYDPANGTDTPVVLPVTIYVGDENSDKWYEAATGSLTSGKLTYLKVAALADPPQVQANMGQPSHGFDVMIVVADNSSSDGTHHFVAGPDSAFY